MKPLAVMPTFLRNENELEITKRAISSLLWTANVELLVVDDGSPQNDLLEELSEFCGARCRFSPQKANKGFSATVNIGLSEARSTGQDALLVNADIVFTDNSWLEAMRANEADVVGAKLLFPSGHIQHAGIYYSIITRSFDHSYKLAPGNLELANQPRRCPVTGALMLIKNHCLKKVGMFDESFRMGWEDVSYCHDVFQAGLECAYEPKASAIHYESIFRGNLSKKVKTWQEESWHRLHVKHAGHDFSEYTPSLIFPDEADI